MFCIFGFILLVVPEAISTGNSHWSYKEDGGPGNWSTAHAKCGGREQSPIDIQKGDESVFDKSLGNLAFHGYGNTSVQMTLTNNGHAAQVNLNGDAWIEGGGLTSKYIAAQFHFHWGSNDNNGSEHRVDGKAFPLEMHIVHYKDDYGSLGNAVNKSDGLAVLGILAKVVSDDNDKLNPLIDSLGNITDKGDEQVLTGVSIIEFLPKDYNRFYRYTGSLTTPSCDESVTWSVLLDHLQISSVQLAKFRALYVNSSTDENAEHIQDNFRPTQPLNSRKVTTNFQLTNTSPSLNYADFTHIFAVSFFAMINFLYIC